MSIIISVSVESKQSLEWCWTMTGSHVRSVPSGNRKGPKAIMDVHESHEHSGNPCKSVFNTKSHWDS